MIVVAGLVAGIAVLTAMSSAWSLPAVVASVRVRRRFGVSVNSAARETPLGGGTTFRFNREWGSQLMGRLVGGSIERRRHIRSERAIPEFLDAIVRRLRSGASLPLALIDAGGRSYDADTHVLAEQLRNGRPLVPVIENWRTATSLPNRRLAAVAIELASSGGGSSAGVLDGVAESLRDRVALEREVAALSSQARASAVVLVLAPFGFAFFAAAIDPNILGVFTTPFGIACVTVGVALDVLGALWMNRLIRRPR